MCVKVLDTVLPSITGLRITFGSYMDALGPKYKMCKHAAEHSGAPKSTTGTHLSLKFEGDRKET